MEKRINIITLGDSGVGKTSILKRIKDRKFDEFTPPTIGYGFFPIKRDYKTKNITIYMFFLDTAGQEGNMSQLPLQYIRNSQIVLLVFENIYTLNVLKKRWYSFYKENTNVINPKFILIGNKSDIFGNDRDEIVENGEKFAEEINAHFITCSAKNADNMDNLERYIITEAKRFIDEEEIRNQNDNTNDQQTENKIFDLDEENHGKQIWYKVFPCCEGC